MKTIKITPNEISIDQNKTILEAMAMLNDYTTKSIRKSVLIVVDNDKRLLGTITDGDIRRAFLRGLTPGSLLVDVFKKSSIVVPEGLPRENILQLMQINQIISIPVVDMERRVVYVECMDDKADKNRDGPIVVVMAGGEGQRLMPLTEKIPKPMLRVGGKPILQIILESLRNYGFNRIIINVRYLSHVIEDYFQDGVDFGISISYIHESKPLGTAGSLGIIPDSMKPNSPFLVVNGDLLTTLNFMVFREFHIAANYDFTLCGRPYEVKIPFGYPVISGDIVTEFREKPKFTHLVNSGIYCISPELLNEVPKNEYFDMPDLIRKTINKGKRVGVFPLSEKFHEIGRHESYIAAEEFYINHFSHLQGDDNKK